MTDSSRSQRGGIATWQGLDYQKRFIAYLSISMLSEGNQIIRITCEDLDDIKVEEESRIIYYQVKLTDSPTLQLHKICDSIKLFSSIEAKKTHSKRTEYVLSSNAKVRKLPNDMGLHSFSELDEEIKKIIRAMSEVRPRISFLDRVYFFRGPELREISYVMTGKILEVLKNYGYDNIEGIKNDLLRRIGEMCPGRIDLRDMPIVDSITAMRLEQKHKSIDSDFVHKIVQDNRPDATKNMDEDDWPITTTQGHRILVPNKVKLDFKIMPTHLGTKTIKRIHEILNEYDGLHDDDLKITYLQKLNDFSKRFDLFKDREFLDFLERQIKNGTNKHIALECLYTLHSLILTSKVENDDSFLTYVSKHYFSFLKDKSESRTEVYEYSQFKIEQIFKEIEKFISIEDLCDMYWRRIVAIVEGKEYSGNKLGICIESFNKNKCQLKSEWRRWLNTKDENSDIKNEILKELADMSIL
jgi:Cap4, dsDNA endonuclease domain